MVEQVWKGNNSCKEFREEFCIPLQLGGHRRTNVSWERVRNRKAMRARTKKTKVTVWIRVKFTEQDVVKRGKGEAEEERGQE